MAGLLPELDFLARLVPPDADLQRVLAEVIPIVARAARSSGKAELVVGPP